MRTPATSSPAAVGSGSVASENGEDRWVPALGQASERCVVVLREHRHGSGGVSVNGRFSRSEQMAGICHTPAISCLMPSTDTGLNVLNDRLGRPEGTSRALWSEQPIPGIRPGMANHAPNRDRWRRGAGPGAKHRILASSGGGPGVSRLGAAVRIGSRIRGFPSLRRRSDR